MNTTATATDRAALRRAAGLLEVTGRRSDNTAVALHCLTAAQRLANAGIHHSPLAEIPISDRAALQEILTLLASVTAELLRDEDLREAAHHVLLAHLEAR